jgi:hypothetical protein
MKPIILRDGTGNLGEIRNHEEPIFMGLDFGYPEAQNIDEVKMREFIKQIEAELCQSTGVPESYLIQSRIKRRKYK